MDSIERDLVSKILKEIFMAKIKELDTVYRFKFVNNQKINNLIDSLFVNKKPKYKSGTTFSRILNFVNSYPEISMTYGFREDKGKLSYNGKDVWFDW
jgi:hypothetical protein